mgnify:FL=1
MAGVVSCGYDKCWTISLQGNTYYSYALHAILRPGCGRIYAMAKAGVNKKLKKVDFTIF